MSYLFKHLVKTITANTNMVAAEMANIDEEYEALCAAALIDA